MRQDKVSRGGAVALAQVSPRSSLAANSVVDTPQPRTAEQQEKANAKVLKRQEERREKIKAAGIDYEFEGHK